MSTHTEATKAKISAAKMKGRAKPPEVVAKVAAAHTGIKRPPATDEHRARISAGVKAYRAAERERKGIAAADPVALLDAAARKEASPWPDAKDVRLTALWAEGHSTTEIGKRIGASKNSVVGRAHRLNLPARPSPIKHNAEAGHVKRRDQPKRAFKATLPPPPSVVQLAPAITAVSVPKHTPDNPVLHLTPTGSGVGRIPSCSPCQWPTTTANGRHRMLCESPADGRTSYCLKHQAESRRSSGMLAATQARLASAHG